MRKCDRLIEVGRRQFLRRGAIAAVGATVVPAARALPGPPLARVAYPSTRLANVEDLRVDRPLDVSYPDEDAPGVLLKLGRPVAEGVGADRDIVGYSIICPHKGFALVYVASDKTFNCPGHYSRFDAEKQGQQIWGQATQNLPQYQLTVDDRGNIFAEAVDELLYGRLANRLA